MSPETEFVKTIKYISRDTSELAIQLDLRRTKLGITSLKIDAQKPQSAYKLGNEYIDVDIWQKLQFSHDHRNHFDILSLHKLDRLKHYGLHFAKYAGRLARGQSESKSTEETCIDSILVALSSANTLHQQLHISTDKNRSIECKQLSNFVLEYASLAGNFCDACEKIDHLEDFLLLAKSSNLEIFNLSLYSLRRTSGDVEALIAARRDQLAARQFYIGSD